MVGLGDIWSFLANAWQWLRSLLVGIGELNRKAWGTLLPYFVAATVAAKVLFVKAGGLVTDFTANLESLSEQNLDDSWSLLEWIGVANYWFPIDVLLSTLLIVFEFWVFCLGLRLILFIRSQFRVL